MSEDKFQESFVYDGTNIDKEKEFNPIKETVGGKAAERVVWSTYSLNAAVDALKKGLPLKANPFIGKNTKLLRPDLVYARNEDEIEDYIRCKEDPVYFASKCYLMTPEGLQLCILRDYQVEYLRHLQNHRFSILKSCRQAGKSVTTAIYCLWVILFNNDKNGLILSKSGPAGIDLIKKIKDMYLYLPYHLKIGTMKWNQSEISFDNNSTISTEAFSSTAGLGKTINFLILDEFAWCPPNDVELFYNNIIPTVTTITNSNVCIMSTQNGFNLFYKIWKMAEEGKSIYGPFEITWDQVPQYNTETKQWEKRTEAWRQEQIGILGSEEAFEYQYGTAFSASDKCLVSRTCLSRLRDKTVLWENRTKDLEEAFPGIFLKYAKYLFWDPEFDFNDIREKFFIILVDLAEGGGKDSTVFNILMMTDKDKFRHIGRWSSCDVDLEHAGFEFWLLMGQLFNNDRCIWSLEWNTYGALFYTILSNLNETEYLQEEYYRFNMCPEGIDLFNFAHYKKAPIDEQVIGMQKNTQKTIPGIRLTSSNKPTSCSLLKILFEKEQLETTDMETINELENFEDKNENGSYKASYGHDDKIMTFVQLPLLQQTPKYKNLLEEFEANNISNNIENNFSSYYDTNPYTMPHVYNKGNDIYSF